MMMTRSRFAGMIAGVAASACLIAAGSVGLSDAKPAQINEAAPDFTLTDVAGNEHTLADYTAAGKIVVLEWFNPDCPVVQSRYNKFEGETAPTLALQEKYADSVVWLRINSGGEGKQGAGKARNEKAMTDFGIETPIVLDMSGEVGKAYGARVTPELYLIDAQGVLRYHGAIDNAQGKRQLGESYYLSDALQAVSAGETVAEQENRAKGCGIHYGS
ncbi:MAG: peroxiredoxin [Phycisphaerales bacterium]|jgi:peroxiredoxin